MNVGEARGAFKAIEFVTVVENAASFPNAVANSFSVSNVPGALATRALISERTYAVVAICVVLVPATAVGAIGVPVKEGDSRGALRASAELNPVLTIDPPMNKLALKDESDATRRPALKETSPVTPNVPCMIEFPPSETEPLLDDIVESPIEIELEPHIM